MAYLPRMTLSQIAELKTELVVMLDRATATADQLHKRYGEISEARDDLEALALVAERFKDAYSRLSTLLLRIAESQPEANFATL